MSGILIYGTKTFERPRENGRLWVCKCKTCGKESKMTEFEIRKWFTFYHTPAFPISGWKRNYFKCFHCDALNLETAIQL